MDAQALDQLPDQVDSSDWVAFTFLEFDSLDIGRLGAVFADDVDVRFGNAPPFLGRSAACEGIGGFWATITGMTHVREQLLLDGEAAVQLSRVTYMKPDGSTVTVPAASHLRRNADGLLDRLWVYIDLAPLFS